MRLEPHLGVHHAVEVQEDDRLHEREYSEIGGEQSTRNSHPLGCPSISNRVQSLTALLSRESGPSGGLGAHNRSGKGRMLVTRLSFGGDFVDFCTDNCILTLMGIAAYNRASRVFSWRLDQEMNMRLSRFDKVVLSVTKAIESGRILRAYNALDREDTTVGPYKTAVDIGVDYVVIGWRGIRLQHESRSARDAALHFVERVGEGRAREAAL
jgi:hypothetical protein